MTWTGTSIDAAAPADENGYFFSLAETGAGASGWYGEDCSEDAVCHEIAVDSVSLACVTAVGDVAASSTTLHCGVESGTSWAFWGGEGWSTIVSQGGENPEYGWPLE